MSCKLQVFLQNVRSQRRARLQTHPLWSPSMEEIAPGITHWMARHPKIGTDVSSYWLPELAVLIDPLAPPEEDSEVWERLDAAPPTLVVVLKPDHVRDVDLVAVDDAKDQELEEALADGEEFLCDAHVAWKATLVRQGSSPSKGCQLRNGTRISGTSVRR